MRTGAMRKLLKLFVPPLPGAATPAPAQPNPVQATKPLTPDQVAVYRAFLKHYLSEDFGLKGVLNIASTTTPFKADASELNGGCLKDFKLLNISGVHIFSDQFADMKDVRVVNASETARHGISDSKANTAIFREGLFTFSEVIFDRSHHYAAVSYSFELPMSGNSGTEIFKLDPGTWKPAHESILCTFTSWMA